MNDKSPNFFSKILKLVSKEEEKQQYKQKSPGGLEIALDTNDRIERSFNL